ncbi:hypothetical protein Dimus_033520 [Dionaea muscipula]
MLEIEENDHGNLKSFVWDFVANGVAGRLLFLGYRTGTRNSHGLAVSLAGLRVPNVQQRLHSSVCVHCQTLNVYTARPCALLALQRKPTTQHHDHVPLTLASSVIGLFSVKEGIRLDFQVGFSTNLKPLFVDSLFIDILCFPQLACAVIHNEGYSVEEMQQQAVAASGGGGGGSSSSSSSMKCRKLGQFLGEGDHVHRRDKVAM